MRIYRHFRRWLGFGCRSMPWADAAQIFRCELSRNHKSSHLAEIENGPIVWNGDEAVYMPPNAPFVNSPREKEFDLIGVKRDGKHIQLK